MKYFLTLLLSIIVLNSVAQQENIDKAKKLIKEKKYESAMQKLNEADPTNIIPEVVIEKTELVLNYFVTSIMHQMFALTDLSPDQDIMDVRGTQGSFSMQTFSPDSLLTKLIEKYPNNGKLKKTLGNYYHEIHLKYPNSWLEPDSVVTKRFFECYREAEANGCIDYWTSYGIGYYYLLNQKNIEAISYFKKSIKLRDDYPSSNYNLGIAFLYTNKLEEGIASMKRALELYKAPQPKSDAARIIGIMYEKLNKPDLAEQYYKNACEINPNDYYNLRLLLKFELSHNKETYLSSTKQFFMLAPNNPKIYQDLMELYWNKNKVDELLNFFKNEYVKFNEDYEVLGNLYFFTAVILHDQEKKNESKEAFMKSEELFHKIFQENHQVFKVIKSYTNSLE